MGEPGVGFVAMLTCTYAECGSFGYWQIYNKHRRVTHIRCIRFYFEPQPHQHTSFSLCTGLDLSEIQKLTQMMSGGGYANTCLRFTLCLILCLFASRYGVLASSPLLCFVTTTMNLYACLCDFLLSIRFVTGVL